MTLMMTVSLCWLHHCSVTESWLTKSQTNDEDQDDLQAKPLQIQKQRTLLTSCLLNFSLQDKIKTAQTDYRLTLF